MERKYIFVLRERLREFWTLEPQARGDRMQELQAPVPRPAVSLDFLFYSVGRSSGNLFQLRQVLVSLAPNIVEFAVGVFRSSSIS